MNHRIYKMWLHSKLRFRTSFKILRPEKVKFITLKILNSPNSCHSACNFTITERTIMTHLSSSAIKSHIILLPRSTMVSDLIKIHLWKNLWSGILESSWLSFLLLSSMMEAVKSHNCLLNVQNKTSHISSKVISSSIRSLWREDSKLNFLLFSKSFYTLFYQCLMWGNLRLKTCSINSVTQF